MNKIYKSLLNNTNSNEKETIYKSRIYFKNVNIKYSITEVKELTYYRSQNNLITMTK
jgi:hypothetical protein